MCPWVGQHAPSFLRHLWGMPSRVDHLSPEGVLLPLVYGTTAQPLFLELRGLSAWQTTPSWTVYRLACHPLLSWLRLTFAMAPDAARPGSDQWLGFTRIGEEERRDGEAIALHKTHIWANSLKPVCFLCFLLFWCPLLPFIETGTLKIYTKMVLYMKNDIFHLKYPLHGV